MIVTAETLEGIDESRKVGTMELSLSDRKPFPPVRPTGGKAASNRAASGEPGWAKGLKTLYNSVVDEPLPDSFEDLLKKLDD